MAISLGSIFVDLVVNHGQFITGFNEAGVATKKFRREFEDAFGSLGAVAEQALAPLGEFGAALGQTIAHVGEYGAAAADSLSGLGGALGRVATLGGLAAGAVAAVAGGSLALAAHTAESIAKMGELAQSTGVGVGALSALGFAGKTVGIDIDTLAKGLEKMDKSVLKAATSPLGAVNAFTRLHIALRDANSEIRPTEQVFGDLAAKFAAMPDGITKTALAMEIFSKGGAVLIPLLNKGKEGIEELIGTAKSLGVVLNDQTVKGSEKFKESLATLSAAGEGLAIKLTEKLLPALNTLAENLVKGFKTGQFDGLINKVAELTKEVITLGYELVHLGDLKIGGNVAAWLNEINGQFQRTGFLLEKLNVATALELPADKRAELQKGLDAKLVENARETARQVNEQYDKGDTWDQYVKGIQKFKDGLNGVKPPLGLGTDWEAWTGGLTPTKKDGPDVSTKKDPGEKIYERIQKTIEALDKEAAAWGKIATAGTGAESLILEAQKKGADEFARLQREAAGDKTGRSQKLVDANQSKIETDKESSFLSEQVKKLNDELDKQAGKFGEDAKAAQALSAAYKQGGNAITDAALSSKFAADAANLAKLVKTQELMAAQLGKDAPAVKLFAQEIEALNQHLEKTKAASEQAVSDKFQEQLNKETRSFEDLAPYVNAVTAAYLQNADAVRKNRIELELRKEDEKNFLDTGYRLSEPQLAQRREVLTGQSNEAYAQTLAQKAAQFQLNTEYDKTLTDLQRIKEAFQSNHQSTLAIDAAIFDEQNKLLHQWDEYAFKVGDFGQKFAGVMNELVIQGKNAGAAISQSFITAIDGIETQFAKLLTGQKANFKQIFQSLSESIAKAGIQQAVGGIAAHFGFDPAKLGKADGSPDKPFHVVLGKGSELPGLGGANSPLEGGGGGWVHNLLGKVFGFGSKGSETGTTSPEGTEANPFYVMAKLISSGTGTNGSAPNFSDFLPASLRGGTSGGGAGSGGFGGIAGAASLSALFGAGASALSSAAMNAFKNTDFYINNIGTFGGAGADGIDMHPGKWYLTGENGPELIGPKNAGLSVMPLSKGSGSKPNVNITNNFNGFKDTDNFRMGESQITGQMHRQMSIAMGRG